MSFFPIFSNKLFLLIYKSKNMKSISSLKCPLFHSNTRYKIYLFNTELFSPSPDSLYLHLLFLCFLQQVSWFSYCDIYLFAWPASLVSCAKLESKSCFIYDVSKTVSGCQQTHSDIYLTRPCLSPFKKKSPPHECTHMFQSKSLEKSCVTAICMKSPK